MLVNAFAAPGKVSFYGVQYADMLAHCVLAQTTD